MNTTSKAIMAVAIVAVLAIAAVGVGLAYTAQTDNSANKADNTYLTLSQTSMTGDLDDNKIAWNSVQTAGETSGKVTVAYYMDSGIDSDGKKVDVDTTTVSGKKLIKVGDLSITAKSSDAIDSFTFKVVNPEKATGSDPSTKLISDTGVSKTDLTGSTTPSGNVTYTYYIKVAFTPDTDKTAFTPDATAKVLDVSKDNFTTPGATFTFSAVSAGVVDGTIAVSLYVEQVENTGAESINAAIADLKPVDFNTTAGFEIDFQAEVVVPTS